MMPRNWLYKQKLKMLGVASIVLLMICFRFSISATIAEYRQYQEHTADRNGENNSTYSLQLLESKENFLTNKLSRFVLDTVDNAKNLLAITGDYCNQKNVILKEYKPELITFKDSLKVFTRNITVEGSFLDCLELVRTLEQKYNTGRVSSVLFKSYEDPASSKTFLTCTILIQNLIISDNEKN